VLDEKRYIVESINRKKRMLKKNRFLRQKGVNKSVFNIECDNINKKFRAEYLKN